MLQLDRTARIVRLPLTLDGLVRGRHAVKSRRGILEPRWTGVGVGELDARQRTTPVLVEIAGGAQRLWYYHGRFYWDDEDLEAVAVGTQVLELERVAAAAARVELEVGVAA
jgi:hypothetical protein